MGPGELRDQDLTAAGPARAGDGARIARELLPRVALILGLLVALDLAARTLWPADALIPWTTAEVAVYTHKVERFAAADAPDVLFLGSSRVRDGVVPEVAAAILARRWDRTPRVFNLGLPNARVEEYRALVHSHLPDPPPPYVIVGLSGTEVVNEHESQFAPRFLWRGGDLVRLITHLDLERFDVTHVEQYLGSVLARRWYLFGQKQPLREGLERFALGLVGGAPRPPGDAVVAMVTAPDGFMPSEGVFRTQTLAERLARNPKGIEVPARELRWHPDLTQGSRFGKLREVVGELRRRGSRVALVEIPPSPYLRDRNPVLHGGGLPARAGREAVPGFRTRMAALADELGVPFVPWEDPEGRLGNEAYGDVNHLTDAGARRFTGTLTRRLLERGFFEADAP